MRLCQRVVAADYADGWATIQTDGVEFRIVFCTDDIIRIRAGFDGEFAEESYSLALTAWEDRLDDVMAGERRRVEPRPVEFVECDDEIVLRGDKLTVKIRRSPFALSIMDAQGTVLHEDVPDLGYREDNNQRRLHSSVISPDDYFYGFGEKAGRLNKSREFMTMNPQDSMGYNAEKTDSLYKHIPFYVKLNAVTKKASGYFYHNTFRCTFDMGRSKTNYWPWHSTYATDGGDIDLFFIAGPSIRDVVRRYTQLTGAPALLPKAALGYLGSSMYYSELPHDADQAILHFLDTAHEFGFPIDGFQLSSGYCEIPTDEGEKRCVLEWSDDRFPDPSRFFNEASTRHVTVSPNVKPGILAIHPKRREMEEAGIFLTDANGAPRSGRWWGGLGYFIDFTNPRAREYWKRELTAALLEHGVTSIWNDNCEYDGLFDLDAHCDFDGKSGTIFELKPVMANLMCKTTVEVLREALGNRRPFVVCRSGYAGIQRYAQTWSGDNETSWQTLRFNVATMLGMSLSGVPNQGSDICGFHGPSPDPELLVRWVQNGVFQPRFSIHSVNSDNTVTEPWMYPEVTDLVRDAIRLRYRLMPYLYALMVRAHETGLPIVEPMCSAFQDDERLYEEDTVFMVGDSLLVASVVEAGAVTRHLTFPNGADFYDFFTRRRYAAGVEVDLDVDLASIPLFIRSGGIVVMADEDVANLAEPVTGLHVVCAPDRDGEATIVEDDGETLSGSRLVTRIAMSAGERVKFEITHDGEYPSTIEQVCLDVISPEMAPFWVAVHGERVPHFLRRDEFDAAARGWYYANNVGSVLVKYPAPHADHSVTVSFEEFDMIGM